MPGIFCFEVSLNIKGRRYIIADDLPHAVSKWEEDTDAESLKELELEHIESEELSQVTQIKGAC